MNKTKRQISRLTLTIMLPIFILLLVYDIVVPTCPSHCYKVYSTGLPTMSWCQLTPTNTQFLCQYQFWTYIWYAATLLSFAIVLFSAYSYHRK